MWGIALAGSTRRFFVPFSRRHARTDHCTTVVHIIHTATAVKLTRTDQRERFLEATRMWYTERERQTLSLHTVIWGSFFRSVQQWRVVCSGASPSILYETVPTVK